jgi:hypothetical protein
MMTDISNEELYRKLLLTQTVLTAPLDSTQTNTMSTQQAVAAKAAQDIIDGKSLKGPDENPVQVATEDLKFGKEKNEDELREKTANVGKLASRSTKKGSP